MGRRFIVDELLAKADVIRAVHERVQLCQDPQTEFALLRDGHTILQEKRAAEICDEVGQKSLERLFGDSRRTVRDKLHTAQASPEQDTKERETLRLQHTSERSWQPNRASRR